MRLKGCAALVTGAGSGIGKSVARRLALEGAHVSVNDLNVDIAKVVAQEIKDAGGQAMVAAGDIADESSVQKIVAAACAGKTLDILVNNAAAFAFGRVDEASSEDWDKAFSVNVRGTALMCKYAIPFLAQGKRSAIVNISSTGALVGSEGMTPYGTSKTAILGLTRCLAVEVAPMNIRVNAVCPGCIWTPALRELLTSVGLERESGMAAWGDGMLIRRWGTPEEVAAAVAFLASNDASYITGTHLVVDGGITVQ